MTELKLLEIEVEESVERSLELRGSQGTLYVSIVDYGSGPFYKMRTDGNFFIDPDELIKLANYLNVLKDKK